MKSKNLGIPYMGSKRKLAPKILDYILENNPNCKYFYDLFGGGGAISFEALQRQQIKQVFYNELNTGVVKLLEKIRKDGVTSEFYEWIGRETFHKLKDGNDWKSGLVKTCWSFGNRGVTYIFGKDKEEYKRLLHEVIVNKDLDCLDKFNNNFKLNLNISKMTGNTVNERRLQLQRIMTEQVKDKSILKGFCIAEESSVRGIAEQIQRIEQLEQLQQIERIEISNLSYEKVKIETTIEETIIYLDPPYENTGSYQKETCHRELENYIRDSKYKIYVSSYDFNLPEVCSWRHRSILSAINNSKVVQEKLFCNREEPKVKQFELF